MLSREQLEALLADLPGDEFMIVEKGINPVIDEIIESVPRSMKLTAQKQSDEAKEASKDENTGGCT